ncbi:hypothetical protein EGW08_014509 [Elysia chlorotica]|uniref:Uncharacterized protein n=1 Tax=Elysia chlorotica TaxID=188477 RepID=A0A3S1BXW7_ELYCH|nr:hypothetical protein EGW08_014509 [Elysia chlorotica]
MNDRSRHRRERETQLEWPNVWGLPPIQHQPGNGQHHQLSTIESVQAACEHKPYTSRPGQDYQFRYDDGLSARLGVRRIPLIMRHHGKDGEILFKPPPYPIDKPLRTQRKQPKPNWTPVKCPVVPCPKPRIHFRQHIGLFCDPNLCPPNETILKHF